MSLYRRVLGAIGRRRMRYQTYQPDPASSTQVEIVNNGNLVCNNAIQLAVRTI